MITANLYPTSTTYPQGDNSELTAEITRSWYSTTDGVTIDSLDAYWLGYISKDNLPMDFKQGVLYVDNGKLIIKDCTDTANFPCGYVRHTNSSGANLGKNLYSNIDGAETWTANSSTFLINQLYPEYAGVGYTAANSYYGYALNITVIGALYDMGGNLLNMTAPNYNADGKGSISFSGTRQSVKQAFDFLFNNATARLSWRHDNYDYYFECTASDFANGSAFLTDITEHMQLRAFIVSYSLQSNVRLYSNNSQNFLTTFAAKIGATYNDSHRDYIRSNIGQDNEYEWWEYSNSDYSIKNRTAEDPYYAVGWGNDEIDVSEIERINTYSVDSGVPYAYTESTFMCRHNQSGRPSKCCFHHIIPIDSIQKHFSLAFRVDVSGILTPSYVANFTYATDVTANNEFLAKLKTGDITNATFKNGLREWQYESLQDNEFEEEDVPPYNPEPEPGGDDTPDDEPEDMEDAYGEGDETQDDIVITAPTQFITQYILDASLLRTVGLNLWSSWVDPNTDVYKNFLFDFFQDTGTFNITAALDYIISLRVYPFSLSGMSIEYLGVSDGVYMGTGHTNFCPGHIPTLNTVIGYLDAGTLDVNIHVPYKDFRDLYNCSVMAFLPFCGTVELNPVEIIGKKLHAKYFIDFQSGACTAVIRVINDGVEYNIASKSGQIGFMLPVTATNSGQLAAQYVGDATRAIGTLSGLFFDVAGSVGRSAENAVKIMSAGEGAEESAPSGMTVTESLHVGKSGVKAALGLANQATDMLSRSGIDMPMLSGGAGAESLFMPPYVCLQVRRGKYAKPNNYPHSVGYYNLSSNPISYYRGAYSGSPATGSNTGKGFCTFTGVDTSGLDCREDERAEILELLNTGIYL